MSGGRPTDVPIGAITITKVFDPDAETGSTIIIEVDDGLTYLDAHGMLSHAQMQLFAMQLGLTAGE